MAAYRVYTPVAGYTGEVAGVGFAKGEAVTDSAVALAYFRTAGYRIEPVDGEQEPAAEPGQQQASRGRRAAKSEETAK